MVADSQGRAVVSVKREAHDRHLDVGARVTAKRQRKNELEEIVDAIITGISDKGVAIEWDEGKGTFAVSGIELASSQDKKDELAEDMLQHEPVKWAQCSTVENNEMLTHVVAATLYQAYVARSSAHDDLHVLSIKGDVQVFATKEMKPGALVLLPFGALECAQDTKAVGVPVVLEIGGEKSGQTTNVLYQIRPKNTPKKRLRAKRRLWSWCLSGFWQRNQRAKRWRAKLPQAKRLRATSYRYWITRRRR